MPTIRLTARGIPSLTTSRAQEEFWDELVPGLALRVGRGGARTWFVRYRANGRYRRLRLGSHPDMSLADAREKARAAIAAARNGADPATGGSARGGPTFRNLVEFALGARDETGRGRPTAHEKNRRWALERDVMPSWGDRPAASISRSDVAELVQSILRRGVTVGANRTLEYVRFVFNEGLRRGFDGLDHNPAHAFPRPVAESPRHRVLDVNELGAIWRATEAEPPFPRAMVRLMILTAQRVADVRAMRWDAIGFADVWRIQGHAGGAEHWVPLSTAAKAVLRDVRPLSGKSDYVFPGRSRSRTGHANDSGSRILARLRSVSQLQEPWTLADFRRTFRTIAERPRGSRHGRGPHGLGLVPALTDAILGYSHAISAADAHGTQPAAFLLAEKRAALEAWGTLVLSASRLRALR